MKINIIGGGISGLALGFFAKRAGFDFTIYESSQICGGVISTQKTPFGLIHHGPHLARLSPELEEVLRFLSIEYLNAEKSGKFLLQNGKIRKISPNFWQYLEILFSIFRKRKQTYTSLADFTKHHFGKTIANVQIQAIVNGIFACNIEELHETALKSIYFTEKRAIYSILKKIFVKIWKHKGKMQIIRPVGGFQTLIDSIVEYLRENIIFEQEIRKIDENSCNFITIPAYFMHKIEGVPENIGKICEKISYQTLSVATIFTETAINLEGVGCLSNNNQGILGVLFNSSAFCEKYTSYSVFYKNFTENEVNEWFLCFFGVKIMKSYHFEYKNAIPLHNSIVNDLILQNSGNTRIFSNYSGQISLSDIFTNAKNAISNLKF
jgi:protoporphyrinogen oxidase